jgi:hypothetical protein
MNAVKVANNLATADRLMIFRNEKSAVRASPNCGGGVGGYGEAVVATVWRGGVKG